MIWVGRISYSYTSFSKKNWNVEIFLSSPHLVDKWAENVDSRGQNIMREHTLLSLLVCNNSKMS